MNCGILGKKAAAPRAPKPPNWRLKPNAAVTVLDKDPLLETREELPFVNGLLKKRGLQSLVHYCHLRHGSIGSKWSLLRGL